ncbi:hypothetical protein UFRH6_103 [Pseudomonas phage UF_RH6]|nr:hypothetical protein UFRH6_103 [Pseudomonas phage UF_RH6]
MSTTHRFTPYTSVNVSSKALASDGATPARTKSPAPLRDPGKITQLPLPRREITTALGSNP